MLTRSHDSDGRLLHDCDVDDCEFSLDGIRRRPPRANEMEPLEVLILERLSLRWWELRRRRRVRRRLLEFVGVK